MTAQETIPSASEEPIELSYWDRPVIRCTDNAKGTAAAAKIFQLTPRGLKLKIPSEVKVRQATQPGQVIAILARLVPALPEGRQKMGARKYDLGRYLSAITRWRAPAGDIGECA